MSLSSPGFSNPLILGTVERGCRGLELGMSFIGLPQNLLRFFAGLALLSCELERLET